MLRLTCVLFFLFVFQHSVHAAGTDVDGKPLIEELANKLKDCDPEGPKMPDNPEEPQPQKDEDDPNKDKEDPDQTDPNQTPDKTDPNQTPDKTDPKQNGNCKDEYKECPGESRLCTNKTYGKMMKMVCKKTCDTCPK